MHPLIVLEIFLLLFGLTIVAIAIPLDSRPIAGFGLLLLGLVGACQLWLAISRRYQYWSLCDIQGGSLLLSYFGGGATTLMLSQTGLIRQIQIADLAVLLKVSIYIVLVAVILFGFGRIESRLWRRIWPDDDDERWSALVALGMLVLGALQAAMIVSGKISLQGTTGIENQELPYFVSMIVALSWPLAGMCGWILGREELRRRPLFFYAALSLIPVEILFNFAHGRRVILFQIVIFFTCLVWARGKGFTLKQALSLGAIALPLAYFLWVIFIALRIESYSAEGAGSDNRTLFARMDSAVSMMDNRWGTVVKGQQKEVVDRVYVIGLMTDMMAHDRITNQFYGATAVYNAVNSIPRILLPDKKRILALIKASDSDVTIRFGLGGTDRAESLVTAAYVDFRWLGPLIYSTYAFLFACVLIGLCSLLRYPVLSLYIICYVFYFALGTEQTFITGTLTLLRTVLVVAVMLFLYRFFAEWLRAAPSWRAQF
jgi:hypothetical protein